MSHVIIISFILYTIFYGINYAFGAFFFKRINQLLNLLKSSDKRFLKFPLWIPVYIIQCPLCFGFWSGVILAIFTFNYYYISCGIICLLLDIIINPYKYQYNHK